MPPRKKTAAKPKEESEPVNAPLIHYSYYCPDCVQPLPMRMPEVPQEAEYGQTVTCSCGWTGEIHPFVRAGV